ncbi:MAG TPA: pyridoxal phosphate-dependent aminotransferase [Leptospiraceae bacterium]|nr:pyridoxal phosphate-dependent aminotransferase [Leptospirales bacterium]HMX55911.1 pyridoxal phosphate-dependent aminotransferase [Leptospiraceae bacterium]HMY44445.1 pyridoxal phosphate-dependent aminotransferase [Leptospiraceae bacterium]HNJ32628.1 pyridoxal phosphate-dependent aminotransferase [Leptospiraceae bacterium]HNN73285.1 pyridoxal phosphate-dependent aminotransferase [Leptospiraceae bacterium]
MNYSAQRLNIVEPSPTLAISAKAAELKAAGRDVIGFGAGEPDFDTPDHIKAAAQKAMAEGQTKYTPVGGTAKLKKAVVDKFKRENGLSYEPKEVIVSTGGKQVLFNLFLAYLNPGEEVIVPAPYWVSYADIVRIVGGVPVIVQCPASQNYLIQPSQIEEAVTPRTRAILLCSPSNPTGSVYSEAELRAIAAVLEKYPDILIISDDIYEHILFDNRKFTNLAMLFPEWKDRIFIANGVSKSYSMTGWRIGYGAGNRALIEGMETMQSQSTSNPSSISQAAALAALEGPQECVSTMRVAFEKRKNIVMQKFSQVPEITLSAPGGAFYVFPNLDRVFALPGFQKLRAASKDRSLSRILSAHLLEKYDVAVVPGIAFGDDSGMRLSFALGEDALIKGLDRIAKMVADLRS